MSTASVNYTGRRKIKSMYSEVTSANLFEILQKAYLEHLVNKDEMEYLWSYYRGTQPILHKTKAVRPEINNKIVENHALEIVDFNKGYVFGEPIQYVRRSDDESISDSINFLNEFMLAENKFAQDDELAEWMYVCGIGCRVVLYKFENDADSPFFLKTLDPRYSFVVYVNDIAEEPLLGVTYIVGTNGVPSKFYCYTKNMYYVVESTAGTQMDILEMRSHILGDVPIVEYPANNRRMGAFEPVIPILDAINNTTSDRLDGIDQFVQSFMKFVNCDIDEETFTSFKQLGAIKINTIDPSRQADVEIVSSELNQSDTQVTKDDLYETMLIICGMPDRKTTRSGGDTGQAVILRDGWGAAESRARTTELTFKKSERRLLKMILKIMESDPIVESPLKIADIDIKFTRNKTDSLQVKTQALMNLLTCGIHPQIAVQNVGLFSDPEQVYVDSKEYLEKWKNQPEAKTVETEEGTSQIANQPTT